MSSLLTNPSTKTISLNERDESALVSIFTDRPCCSMEAVPKINAINRHQSCPSRAMLLFWSVEFEFCLISSHSEQEVMLQCLPHRRQIVVRITWAGNSRNTNVCLTLCKESIQEQQSMFARGVFCCLISTADCRQRRNQCACSTNYLFQHCNKMTNQSTILQSLTSYSCPNISSSPMEQTGNSYNEGKHSYRSIINIRPMYYVWNITTHCLALWHCYNNQTNTVN
jgi:hypothetical protein